MVFSHFFVLKSVYFISCCSITNTVISLVAHKLHSIHMNHPEKFRTRSCKLKVKSTQSKIANDVIVVSRQIFHRYLFSFFCFLFHFFGIVVVVFFVFFIYFFKLNTYILMQIRPCGQLNEKKNHPDDFRKQDNFFWPKNSSASKLSS